MGPRAGSRAWGARSRAKAGAHDVTQLANGNLLVIDDGASRPGCYELVTANCFSRAVMYEIDEAASTASVLWQFAYPFDVGTSTWGDVMADDVYNACGGSVDKLANGNYLVAFTGMSNKGEEGDDYSEVTRTALAWEIDADAGFPGEDDARVHGPQVRSALKIPIPHSNVGLQNGYRLVPWSNIAGESTDEPW